MGFWILKDVFIYAHSRIVLRPILPLITYFFSGSYYGLLGSLLSINRVLRLGFLITLFCLVSRNLGWCRYSVFFSAIFWLSRGYISNKPISNASLISSSLASGVLGEAHSSSSLSLDRIWKSEISLK